MSCHSFRFEEVVDTLARGAEGPFGGRNRTGRFLNFSRQSGR